MKPPSSIRSRKLISEVKREIVGRPMGWKPRYGCLLLRADPNGLAAIAAIFRSQDELVLGVVEIALWPAVVGAALELDQLLGRLIGALDRRAKARPVLA